ncbi:MarR family winged helix-turn-helix transcriptional regulator [Kibdelosporangium aridum]|uniref:DNA-binding transcriptional regulator, MarR family n=1 Tax=Kibdelosporangium aridum TaxID=2030 RepID=A0A1W2DBT8_KIBAR|nr:MarR family transcriptional regulator [Kibdelosporangium aridum]SMC94920.1 DNA-binding transcriptional regulator, MarR family [Kibdelosporangium aridum]
MKPTPEDYIGLIRQVRSLMEVQHATTMRSWEETRVQPGAGKLLAELAYRGESRVSDLAELRFVDASVVSRQAAQLEKLGLIERRRAPEDRRAALLSVTPEGEKVLEQWRQRQVDAMAEALSDWDADEVTAATEHLERINAALRSRLSS